MQWRILTIFIGFLYIHIIEGNGAQFKSRKLIYSKYIKSLHWNFYWQYDVIDVLLPISRVLEILSLFIYKCRTHLTGLRKRNMKSFCLVAQNLDRHNFVLVNHIPIKLVKKRIWAFIKSDTHLSLFLSKAYFHKHSHTLNLGGAEY